MELSLDSPKEVRLGLLTLHLLLALDANAKSQARGYRVACTPGFG